MSDDEVRAFLDEERIVTCASFGPRGWPHLMPLWYVVRDGTLWSWTYAKSQKVLNLERDTRCTLQVEAGRDGYHEAHRVEPRCGAAGRAAHREPHGVRPEGDPPSPRAPETLTGVGMDLPGRYSGAEPAADMRE